MASIQEKNLRELEYQSRETGEFHHEVSQEEYLIEKVKSGDESFLEDFSLEDDSIHAGHLSDDPVQRFRYLFMAVTTIITRVAISEGMNKERAFNISDIFIYRMDHLTSQDQITALLKEELAFFMREIQAAKRKQIFSRAVAQGIDYIEKNLHSPLSVGEVADHVGLSASYYSDLFKRETGHTVAVYIMEERIETAKNLLRYSDLPYADISATLSFSSQSHFIRLFKQYTGMTPAQFRRGR